MNIVRLTGLISFSLCACGSSYPALGEVPSVSGERSRNANFERRYTDVICDGSGPTIARRRVGYEAISNNGNWLLLTPDFTPNHRAYVLDRSSRTVIPLEITQSNARITSATFSNSSQYLALGYTAGEESDDAYILLFDLIRRTYEIVGAIGEWYEKPTFSHDDRMLIYATTANYRVRSDDLRPRLARPSVMAVEALDLEARERRRLLSYLPDFPSASCENSSTEQFLAWGFIGRLVATKDSLVVQSGNPIGATCESGGVSYAAPNHPSVDEFRGWLRFPYNSSNGGALQVRQETYEILAAEGAIRNITSENWVVSQIAPRSEPNVAYSPSIERIVEPEDVRGYNELSQSTHQWALSPNGAFAWAPMGDLHDRLMIVENPLAAGRERFNSQILSTSEFGYAPAVCVEGVGER